MRACRISPIASLRLRLSLDDHLARLRGRVVIQVNQG
jgi:hypothetical protein